MRASLIFPPSICLPNQIYYALPLLSGALRRAGHQPHYVDLNLLAADWLLDDSRVGQFESIALDMIRTARNQGADSVVESIRSNLDRTLPIIAEGESAKTALRDPKRFYDRPTFRRSFWAISEVLGSYYQLDPLISPFRERFAADMLANQQADGWTMMSQLYEEGLLDEIFENRPEMLGICVAFPEQAVEAVRVARRVRQRDPSIHICMGGPLISADPKKWLENNWLLDYCDSVCVGDGETAIVELCDALEGKRAMESVRNMTWRDSKGEVHRPTKPTYLENMDDLPVPDFESTDMTRFFLPEPIYPIMLSRGCYWGKCTFCSIGWKKNYRMASAAKIEADTLEVTQRYGGRFLYPQDSSIPPKAAEILSGVIRDNGVEAYWYGGMRFEHNLLDKDYCERLAAGGCRSLCMGFESSDQRLLDLMDKGIRFEDMPMILDNMREAGISAELLWFIGFPTQTRRDVFETAKYLYERRDKFGLSSFVGSYALHPDSVVFERPQDFKIKLIAEDNSQYTYESEEGLAMNEIQELKDMFSKHDNRTLTCNGSHLPHLAITERNTEGIGNPLIISDELVNYCK
jgi:hypothetical protein